jgi:hypothetical protein
MIPPSGVRTLAWLSLKQSRLEVLLVVCTTLIATGLALAAAAQLAAVGAPLECLARWHGPVLLVGPDGRVDPLDTACGGIAGSFLAIRDGTAHRTLGELLGVVPLAAGVVLGATLVSTELEDGAASLSWVYSGARWPWLVTKYIAGLGLLIPLMLMFAVATNVLAAAQSPHLDPSGSLVGYLDRGPLVVFWAIAAFSGAAALGALFGRTAPAIIVGLALCVLVRGGWEPGMRHTVLVGLADRQAVDTSAGPYLTNPDLDVYQAYYLDGVAFNGDVAAWFAAHAQPAAPGPTSLPGASPTPGTVENPDKGMVYVNFVVPGPRYWFVATLEGGLLVTGAALLSLVAWWAVKRRRP